MKAFSASLGNRQVGRRGWAVWLVVLAAAAAGLPASAPFSGGASPAPPVTKVTITEGAHVIGFSPIYLALQAGLFRDEGLDVELVTVGGGAISIAAAVGGSALIALSGGPEAVDAARKGSPVRIVLTATSEFASNVVASTRFVQAKGVTRGSPLGDRVKALKGAKIAITSPGSSTDQLIRFLLKKYGMNPDTEVEIVALRTGPPMLAALKQGSVDALVLSPPTGEQAVAEGYGMVLINPLAGEIPEIRGHIFHVGSANLRDIRQHPEVITRAIKAVYRAQRMMRIDKVKARQVLQAYFKDLDPQVFALAYADMSNAFPSNPVPARKSVEVALHFATLMSGRPVDATYEQVVEPKLAEQAVREVRQSLR